MFLPAQKKRELPMFNPTPVRAIHVPVLDECGQKTNEFLTLLPHPGSSPLICWVYWRSRRIGFLFVYGDVIVSQSKGPDTAKPSCCPTCASNQLLRDYTTDQLDQIGLNPGDWELSEALYGDRLR